MPELSMTTSEFDKAATLAVHIRFCPRCLSTHNDVAFQPLLINVKESDVTHWAMCPATQQPILLAMSDDAQTTGDIS